MGPEGAKVYSPRGGGPEFVDVDGVVIDDTFDPD